MVTALGGASQFQPGAVYVYRDPRCQSTRQA
jgi:hypothetical protein